MKHFKHREKYTNLGGWISCTNYIHVLLQFTVFSALCCPYSGTQNAQAAAIRNITGPGWFLTDVI